MCARLVQSNKVEAFRSVFDAYLLDDCSLMTNYIVNLPLSICACTCEFGLHRLLTM